MSKTQARMLPAGGAILKCGLSLKFASMVSTEEFLGAIVDNHTPPVVTTLRPTAHSLHHHHKIFFGHICFFFAPMHTNISIQSLSTCPDYNFQDVTKL